jgi:hypothetical protein
MEIKSIKDPYSGEIFVPKRIDQRFANRQNQIKYNNLLAKKKRIIKGPYDRPLDHCRKVLKKVLGNEIEVVRSRDFLSALEYDFGFSMYQALVDKERNITGKGIYEYLIIPMPNNQYKITKYDTVFGNQ